MYNVDDVFERKDFEYTIVAKVKHESQDGYVYMVKIRRFGEEEVDYKVFDEGAFFAYQKTKDGLQE